MVFYNSLKIAFYIDDFLIICVMWSLQQEVYCVIYAMSGGQYKVCSVQCAVFSVKYEVWSVKYEVWSVKYEVWSVKC